MLLKSLSERIKFTHISVIYSLKGCKMAQREGTRLESSNLEVCMVLHGNIIFFYSNFLILFAVDNFLTGFIYHAPLTGVRVKSKNCIFNTGL